MITLDLFNLNLFNRSYYNDVSSPPPAVAVSHQDSVAMAVASPEVRLSNIGHSAQRRPKL